MLTQVEHFLKARYGIILKLFESQTSFNSTLQIGIDVIMLAMLAALLVVKASDPRKR